jgi:hypothetical protein
LAAAIERKWVRVRQIKIPDYQAPDRRDPFPRFVYEAAMRDTGNEEHGSLKWRAWNWLLEKWKCVGHFEAKFRDLRFDLYAKERRIAVECGDTDPEKFLHSVTRLSVDGATVDSLGVRRFLVLPRYEDSIFEFTVTRSGADPMSRHLRWRRELTIERNNFEKQARDPDAYMHPIGFQNGDYAPEDLGVPSTPARRGTHTVYYL